MRVELSCMVRWGYEGGVLSECETCKLRGVAMTR